MRCPRCDSGIAAAAAACPRCAAPLLLADEPALSALDREIRIDRRGRARDLELEQAEAACPEIEEGTVEIHLPRAPTARRLAAAAIDAAVALAFAGPPLALVAAALPGGGGPAAVLPQAAALAAVIAFAHAVLGHVLLGATLGKRLLGLRVAGPDGAPPSLPRSAARAALALAGAVPLGLGPAVALFTRSGRALHDLATRTVVVRAP
ncbi:MAG TPA: RDD family protein [Anaeromyxobacteraceae bacterium]|nr:RDD family protein [Anaeromyxobacteraceae bacterium]